MTEKYKPLHYASTLCELETIANKGQSLYKRTTNVHTLCKSMDLLKKTAQHDPQDQEKVFIYLTRYINLKTYLSLIVKDGNFIRMRFDDSAEMYYQKVKRSLIERYSKETTKNVKEEVTSNIKQEENVRFFKSTFISSRELYEVISQKGIKKKVNILVIDVRPANDFQSSHMKNVTMVNVPDELIKSGLSANRIGTLLPEETAKIWEKRDKYQIIVILDWATHASSFESSKVETLRSALVEWDINRSYMEPPIVLDGGYLDWLQKYPFLCTNPQVRFNQVNSCLDDFLDFDQIEYPKASEDFLDNTFGDQLLLGTEEEQTVALEDKLKDAKVELVSELYDIDTQINNYKNNEGIDEVSSLRKTQLNESKAEIEHKIKELEEKLQVILHEDDITNTAAVEKPKKVPNEEASSKKSLERTPKVSPQVSPITSPSMSRKKSLSSEQKSNALILEVVKEQRQLDLQKARAQKPKSIQLKEKDSARQSETDESQIVKPIFDRATKPRSKTGLSENKLIMTPGLVGLRNIKNTCYMNTVLQCLRNLPIMKELFCTNNYEKHLKKFPDALYLEITQLFRTMFSTKEKFIAPYRFYEKLCILDPIYSKGNHEDCMEFFLTLVNHLHEDCASDVAASELQTPMQRAWYRQMNNKTSIFMSIFYHQIRITQICTNCDKKAFKFEVENTIMCSVPNHPFSLNEAVNDYLDDFCIENYCCSVCKRQVVNQKSVCIHPKVLVIVLKRYAAVGDVSDDSFSTLQKVHTRVSFTVKGLIFGKRKYDLSCVALHTGSLLAGHYTAACLVQNRWYEFNDEAVIPIDIDDDALKYKACAFFYSLSEEAAKM